MEKNTCILFSVSKTNMEIDFSKLSLEKAFPTEISLFSKCGFVFLPKILYVHVCIFCKKWEIHIHLVSTFGVCMENCRTKCSHFSLP